MFQRCHHNFQCVEADMQLCMLFLGCNPLICVHELTETLFILWCDSCAWSSGIWLVFHVTCCHCWNAPLITSHCSHELFGLHKCSGSINECEWVPLFPHGGIQWYTFVSCTLRCHTTASLLSSVTPQQNTGGKVHPLLPSHQHPPLMSRANVIQ